MACVKNNNRLYQEPWVCNFAPSARSPPPPKRRTPAPALVSLAASLQHHWVLMTRRRTLLTTALPPPTHPPTRQVPRSPPLYILYLFTLDSAAENLGQGGKKKCVHVRKGDDWALCICSGTRTAAAALLAVLRRLNLFSLVLS